MIDNPYAPPQATDGTITGDARMSPPLWNPTAAAFWCLVFGVMFGSWIHMKNWQVLRKPDKAAASRRWLIGTALLFLASLTLAFAMPESAVIGKTNFFLNCLLLFTWYLFNAREQIRFVAAAYGKGYQRRGWGTPLLYSLLALIGVGVAGAIAGIIATIATRAA